MPKYTMPDGNIYDFSSDAEATDAMEAWQKQFGSQPNVETAADVADEFSQHSFPSRVARGIGGTIAAVGEVPLQMIAGTPEFLTGTLGKLGSVAAAATEGRLPTAAELEHGANVATPEAFKRLSQAEFAQPQTAIGKLASKGLMEAFNKTGRGIGAAVASAIAGEGQSGAQRRVEDSSNQAAALSSLALDVGMVGSMVKGGVKSIRDYKEAKLNRELVEAEEARKAAEAAKPPEPVPTEPTGELIGAQFGGRKAMPWDTPEETRPPSLPLEIERDANIGEGSVQPAWQKETGVDFPLRQEVLQHPEISAAIDAFRSEADRLQTIIDKAIDRNAIAKAKEDLAALQQEFAAGMKQLGIETPQDATGLSRPLYEGGGPLGKGETRTQLPVEKTFDGTTLGGVGKKQGGAIGTKSKTPSFDEFKKTLAETMGREVSEDVARAVYDKRFPNQPDAVKKAVSKIPGMSEAINKYESRDITKPDESISRMAEVGSVDLDKPAGKMFTNVMPAGRLQAWAMDNPIVHEGIMFISSVKDGYRIKTANAMSEITRSINFFESKLASFSNISWKQAAEVFDARRKNEFNSAYDPASQFSGVQLELFNTIDSTLKGLYKDINTRLKEINPDHPGIKQLPYYFTSFFHGDWVVPVFSKEGKFLFNLRENSKANAKLAGEWASKNGFNIGEVGVRKTSKWGDKRLNARTDFEEMIRVLEDTSPEVQEALTRMISSADTAAMGTRSMPNRFKHKEGRVGSMGDRPWRSEKENYIDNKDALSMFIEGANEWLANTEITEYTKKMNENKDITAENAKSFVNDYADYVTNNKEQYFTIGRSFKEGVTELTSKLPSGKYWADGSKFKNGIRTLANAETALLTGFASARMVAQNIIQPTTATLPKLAELAFVDGYKGNPLSAYLVGHMTGLVDSIQAMAGGAFGTSKTLDHKTKNHITDIHLVESNRMFDNYHANFAWDVIANKSVQLSEMISRNVAFNIYVEYLKSSGMSEAKAFDMAKNITHETMTNYEGYAKPQLFTRSGVAGEIAGRLQTFKANSVGQLANYTMKMKVDSPATWVPLTTALVMTLATAGAVGLIGMDVMELLWEGVQLADRSVGKPHSAIQENSPKKFIYDHFPDVISLGALSHYSGLGLQGAFAQNLVSNSAAKSIFPVFGNIAEQITAPFNLASDSSLSKAKGLKAVLPASAAPYIEQKFQTAKAGDGDTVVVSPTTGKPVWKGKDGGYVKSYGKTFTTNIPTIERSKSTLENQNLFGFKKDVTDTKKEILGSLEKYSFNAYKGLQNGESIEKYRQIFKEKIDAYVEAGGDPDTAVNAIVSQMEEYGIGDQVIKELISGFKLNSRKEYIESNNVFQRRRAEGR